MSAAGSAFNPSLKKILYSKASTGIAAALAHYDEVHLWPQIADVNHHPLLNQHTILSGAGVPIRFVASPSTRARGFQTLYQPRIFLKGEVSTRANSWHDFFNAMVWLSFPKIKAYINRRHFFTYDAVAPFPWNQAVPHRTKEQDALTIFDEGGAIALVRTQQHMDDYKNLSANDRKTWLHQHLGTNVKVFIFGHAIHEVLLMGHKDIVASGIWLVAKDDFFNQTDAAQLREVDHAAEEWLNQKLATLHTKDFTAIPVSGLIVPQAPQ